MTPEVVCTVVLLVVFVAAVDVSALVVLVPAADKRDLLRPRLFVRGSVRS